jgi:2-dehydropantoate 2-reductase
MAALRDLVPLVGDATILIMSANWTGYDGISEFVPENRCILGYPDGGGTRRDGEYWTNLGGEIHLGRSEGMDPEKFQAVVRLFEKAGIIADIQPSILHWLWIHNAGVVGFSAGLARYRNLTEYLDDRDLLRRSILATRELYDLCEHRGVHLKGFPETRFMKIPVFVLIPLMRRNFRTNEIIQRYTAHATSDGNLIETKMFCDEMIATADQLGCAIPETRSLVQYLEGI